MSDREKSLLGRIIVFVLFTSFVAYFGIAILGSIVADLYGRPPPEESSPGSASNALTVKERTWCIRSLVGLRDELEGQVTLEMQHPKHEGDPYARWRVWSEAWRDKYTAARARCAGVGNPTLERAYDRLADMGTNYDSAVVTVIRTRSELSSSLQEELTQLKKRR